MLPSRSKKNAYLPCCHHFSSQQPFSFFKKKNYLLRPALLSCSAADSFFKKAAGITILLMMVTGLFSFPADISAQQQALPEAGLGLSEAVAIVLKESPLSRIAEADVLAADYGKKAARSEFLPKLKVDFNYTVLDEAPGMDFFEGEPDPANPWSLLPPMEVVSTRQMTAQGTLEQPLFTGFALLSQYRIAGLGQQEASIKQRMVQQELILQTHEAYFRVLVTEKYLDVAEQAVTQLEAHAEVSRQFYESGMIPKNDLLKALVQIADAKRKRIEAGHQLDLARSRFNTLLRWEIDRPFKLKETLVFRPYNQSLKDCIRIAREHHPELLLADLSIKKADKGITLARSSLYPSIFFAGGVRHEDGTFSEDDYALSATLHVEWALWEWGGNYYKIQQRLAQRLQTKMNHAQKIDSIHLQVREAYLSLKEWQEALDVAQASIEQAEENYRITEEQFKENITTSTEVLDAQTLLGQAQVNYYSALSNYNTAVARLERVMGVLKAPLKDVEAGPQGEG